MTSIEATNSVFNITDENNKFSTRIPGRGRIPNYLDDDIIEKLKNLQKFKSQNDIELHVQEVRKRGNQIKKIPTKVFLSDFDTSKKETLKELKKLIIMI